MALRIERPPTAFSLSTDARKRPRKKQESHLDFIRQLPCLIGEDGPTEAAHVRYQSISHGKAESGLGKKPNDCWTVPLSATAHRRQHSMNEREFWRLERIDPLVVAALLYANSGDEDAGLQIIRAAIGGRFPWRHP